MISLLPKPYIARYKPASVTVQAGLCWTCTENPNCWFSPAHAQMFVVLSLFIIKYMKISLVYIAYLKSWNQQIADVSICRAKMLHGCQINTLVAGTIAK